MKYIFWEHDRCCQMSGLPKLILLCVEAMSKSEHVMLISHPESLVHKILKEKGVKYIYADERTVQNCNMITSEDILISDRINKNLFKLHRQNPRLILWSIIPGVYPSNKYSRIMQRIQIKKVVKESALIAMDDLALRGLEKTTGLKLPRVIVPVPMEPHECRYVFKKDTSLLNISYLGRAVDWKIYPVIRLVRDLEAIKNKSFFLHVFTDNESFFDQMLAPYLPSNVNIQYHIGCYGQHLLNELCKMHLHFAMGISTLEGASIGVPTLTAPMAKRIIPEGYKWHYMFEDADNAVSDTWEADVSKGLGHSMMEIVNMYDSEEIVNVLSQKCYQAAQMYTPDVVVQKLKNISTTLHVRHCNYRMLSFWLGKGSIY